jgi:hypothetical protein
MEEGKLVTSAICGLFAGFIVLEKGIFLEDLSFYTNQIHAWPDSAPIRSSTQGEGTVGVDALVEIIAGEASGCHFVKAGPRVPRREPCQTVCFTNQVGRIVASVQLLRISHGSDRIGAGTRARITGAELSA